MHRSLIAPVIVLGLVMAGCGGSGEDSGGPGTFGASAFGAKVSLILPADSNAGDVREVESYRDRIDPQTRFTYARLSIVNDGDDPVSVSDVNLVTADRRTLKFVTMTEILELPRDIDNTVLYNQGVDLHNAYLKDQAEALPGATTSTLLAFEGDLPQIKNITALVGNNSQFPKLVKLAKKSSSIEAPDPGARLSGKGSTGSGTFTGVPAATIAPTPSPAPEVEVPSSSDAPNGECQRVDTALLRRIDSRPAAGVTDLVLPSAYRLQGVNGTVVGGFLSGTGPTGVIDGEFGTWYLAADGTLYAYTDAALTRTRWPRTGTGEHTPLSERVRACAAANAG